MSNWEQDYIKQTITKAAKVKVRDKAVKEVARRLFEVALSRYKIDKKLDTSIGFATIYLSDIAKIIKDDKRYSDIQFNCFNDTIIYDSFELTMTEVTVEVEHMRSSYNSNVAAITNTLIVVALAAIMFTVAWLIVN